MAYPGELDDLRHENAVLKNYIPRIQDWARKCEAVAKDNFDVAQKVREYYGGAYEILKPKSKYVGVDMPVP